MVEENISQEFRLKNLDNTRYHFLEEMKLNELMSKKYENASTTLNYSGYFLILVSTTTGCSSISAFTFLIYIPIGSKSSAKGLKTCAITAGIQK